MTDIKDGPQGATPGGTDNKSYDRAAETQSSSNGSRGIDFGELLIGILHHGHGDSTSVCWMDQGNFRTTVKSPHEAVKFAKTLPKTDTWFGVNPVSVLTQGRGKAEDVLELRALWADLDYKETGCKTPEIAIKVVEDLSAILGTEPMVVTDSGHGLQPFWRVYNDRDHKPGVTLRRWGRLVAAVAARHHAKVDNVFDLPRILRVPGTYNCKGLNGEKPIPVVTHRLGGKPLHLAEVDRILGAHGVFTEPEDTQSREPISKPAGWEYGATCSYVGKVINAIPADAPKAGRHQWMVSKCVKLASAARLGCISEADFDQGTERLHKRLVALRDETGEEVPFDEVPAAMAYAIETVSCKTDEETLAELGNHHEHRGFADSAGFAEGVGPSDEGGFADSAYFADGVLFDGDPIPLTQPVHIPDFPVGEFPKTYSDMISGVSEATQTDPAMAGTSALAALAAATAGRVAIEVRSGWTEPLCLYLAAIAYSGQRKSSVHKEMTHPIQEVEDRLAEEARQGRAEAVARKQVAEHLVARLTRAAAADSAGATEMAAAIQAAQNAAAIEVPPNPRLIADDTTPEAAGSLLAEQGGRIAIISAEGGIFDIMAGRYNQGVPNLDLWNKAHAGDPLKVDRKGRESESVPHPAMTLGLMIQPAVLNAIASKHEFRGTGLLARFLYAYPESKVGRRRINTAPVSKEVRDSYTTALSNLTYELAQRTGTPITLTLTEEAHKEVVAIETALEPSLATDEELGSLADWGSKYMGAIARIAGILHLAEHGMPGLRRKITKETITRAIKISEYFKACAINAFAEMGADPVTADAIYLLERVGGLDKEVVSERDLFNACSRFKKMPDLKPAVARLVDHGFLAALPAEKTAKKTGKTAGRPASPLYKVLTPSAEYAQYAKPPRGGGQVRTFPDSEKQPPAYSETPLPTTRLTRLRPPTARRANATSPTIPRIPVTAAGSR